MFETASVTEGYQTVCQDRVAVLREAERTLIIVADGAGGSGAGDRASAAVLDEVRRAFPAAASADGWCEVLRATDLRIGDGESTAVVVDLQPDHICGASVGDSQAWIIKGADILNLTERQHRKPLLGSGGAVPTGFTYGRLDGLLLVATDGFCNYVKRPELVKVVPFQEFAVLPRRLLGMVRLKSGQLWDDVGIVVCRYRPQRRSATGTYRLSLEDFA